MLTLVPYLKPIAFILECAGLLFLFREVWLSHKASGYESSYTQLNRIIEFMRSGQWLEAYALFYIYENPRAKPLAEARAFANGLGAVAAQNAMQQNWQARGLQAAVDESYTQYVYRTAPAVLAKRARLFWLGVVLVVASLLFQLADMCVDTPPPIVEHEHVSSRLRVHVTGPEIIHFDTAHGTLQYVAADAAVDLSDTVCRAKAKLQATQLIGVVVVGRYDHRRLRRTASQQLTSNEALAQSRADSVANYLRSADLCGPAVAPVITLVGAPRFGKTGVVEEGLAADRSVEIYALTTTEERVSVNADGAPAERF